MPRFIDPNTIHSAIDTWSGFIYQGKVSLYHVLHLICNDNLSYTNELQLDSLEDFAILDEKNKLLSLHQVKAVNNTTYTRFKEDFEKLEARRASHPCDNAYFHLAKQNEKDNAALQAIHPNIELYEYSNGNSFCELNQIEPLIEDLISSYLVDNHLDHLSTPYNLKLYRNKLEALIFTQVIDIHSINHKRHGLTISEGAYYFTIPFQEFINILTTDPGQALDQNYFLNTAKMLINNWFMEFGSELEDNGVEINDITKEKMLKYLDSINSLDNGQLIQLLQSITPQRMVAFDTLEQFNDGLQKTEFFDGFVRGLYELISCQYGIRKLVWKSVDQKQNAITGINNPSNQLTIIANRILKNIKNNDVEIPYEIDRLITSDLETNSLNKLWNNQHTTPEQELNIKNNITKWGVIGLIKLENIKNEINEEDN